MIGSFAEIATAVDCILVVDDLPDNCFLLQTVLENEGYYDVVVANNGRVMASHPPDLVLLDVMMPEMKSLVACGKILLCFLFPVSVFSKWA